jgi:hypothetical protein
MLHRISRVRRGFMVVRGDHGIMERRKGLEEMDNVKAGYVVNSCTFMTSTNLTDCTHMK